MSDPNRCPKCGAELSGGALGGLCPKCLLVAGLESGAEAGQAAGSGSEAPTTPHSGSFVPPDAAWLAGHFPQLEILELLGQGGMGAVYKARQPKLDRIVALKIIRPESADDPAFAERFNREARMLARLSHPHIVAVYDFGEVNVSEGASSEPFRKLYYFLMEYVDGTNLRQLLQTGELLPGQALAIVPQICEALQFAHDEGVVHRDIKPENILLDKRGRVKIADFGLAKLAAGFPQDFTLTGTHQVMGTPRYMAPEQMEASHAVDHRADIYSLGVVFYEMLTGEVPMGHFEPPSKKLEIDVRLDEVVLRALAREPQRRYQQASEVKTDLESISHVGKAQPPSTAASPQVADAINRQVSTGHGRHLPVPLFALVLALIGATASFLPWGEIITGSLTVHPVPGWKWWQGLLGCFSFVAVLATLLATLPARGLVLWRSIVFVLAGLLAIVATISYMLEMKLGSLPVMPFIEAAGRDMAMDRIPKTIGESLHRSNIGAGAFIALFAGIAMALLGAGEIAVRSLRIRAGIGVGKKRMPPDDAGTANQVLAAAVEVRAPAIALTTVGIFEWIACWTAAGIAGLAYREQMVAVMGSEDAMGSLLLTVLLLGAILSTLVIIAGLKMRRFESYAFCIFGSVVAMLVSPGNVIGLPIGIWSLYVLTRPDVKAAFASLRVGSEGGIGSEPRVPKLIYAVGVSQLLLGLLILTGIGISLMFPEVEPDEAWLATGPVIREWGKLHAAADPWISGGLAYLLLASGIGLLLARSWGRTLALTYAVTQITWGIASWPLYAASLGNLAREVSHPFDGEESIAITGAATAMLFLCVLEIIYPLFVLIVLNRPRIRQAFVKSETTGSGNVPQVSSDSRSHEHAQYGEASSKPLVEDFLLMNPRLPASARWITIYAIVVRPVLWILVMWLGFLGLMSSLGGDHVELALDHIVDVVGGLCALLFVVVAAVGGVKLRALRHDGPRWIKIGLGLGIGFVLLMFIVHLTFVPWFVGPIRAVARTNPELLSAEGFTQEEIATLVADKYPLLSPDAMSLLLVLLWLALDIAAFVWLWRNSRILPLSDGQALLEPQPAGAEPTARAGPIYSKQRGTLGQAWDEWWAERDRWFTRAVLVLLLVIHIGCLAMFLALRGGGGYDSGRASAWHHVGWPSPWFVYERGVEPNVAFRRTTNLLSWSILIAGIGMVAWYAFWRIQLVRDSRNVRFWRTLGSPTALLIVWILAGVTFAWLGVRSADRLYESMRAGIALAEDKQSSGLEQRAEPSDVVIPPPEQKWTMTSDGPMLTDGFARVSLELDSAETDELNGILQGTSSEYLKIEQQYLERQKVDDRHVIVTIKPHPEAVAKLEDSLWTQLDAVLDPEQERIARLNFQLEPLTVGPGRSVEDLVKPGFFGWGKEGATIEIWQVGTWYHWKVRTRRLAFDTDEYIFEGPELPEWLRRYWKEPDD